MESKKNFLTEYYRGVGKGGSKGAVASLVFYDNGIHFFDSTPLFKFVPVDLCTCGSFSM